MTTFNPALPATDLLPKRASSCRGAGLTWTAATQTLALTVSSKRDDRQYRLTEFDADPSEFMGRGFQLEKLTAGSDPEADGYAVLISDHGPAYDTCECRGWLRHGHCCHLDAVRTLITNGWLEMTNDEYAAWSAQVEATHPDIADPNLAGPEPEPQPEPAPPKLCCLCRKPLHDGQPIDRSGIAHQTCSDQEWADIDTGWQESVNEALRQAAARCHEQTPLGDDGEPDWVREGGQTVDVPF